MLMSSLAGEVGGEGGAECEDNAWNAWLLRCEEFWMVSPDSSGGLL